MSGLMELAIGPLLFNWPAERVEAFYLGNFVSEALVHQGSLAPMVAST